MPTTPPKTFLLQQGKQHIDPYCTQWITLQPCSTRIEACRLITARNLNFVRILDANTGRILEERRPKEETEI